MIALSDTIQTSLHYGLPGCALLVIVIWQAARIVSGLLKAVRIVSALVFPYIIPIWRPKFWLWAAFLTIPVWMGSASIHDLLQAQEYRWRPVYENGPKLNPAAQMEVYESEIRKHISGAQFDTLKAWTEYTAGRINTSPLCIYEAALLECGLKPFDVRKDLVAAGWIQFTDNGCASLSFTKEQVIRACRRKDITFVMRATDEYLYAKWQKAGRPPVMKTIDLYLAIFAPAHIGRDANQVVYAGFNNRSYYLNAGLDGWYMEPSGLIVRKDGAKDGRITIWEIYLCLTYKKGRLLKL